MHLLDCEIEKLADAVAAAIGQRPAPRAFRNAVAAEYLGIGPETLDRMAVARRRSEISAHRRSCFVPQGGFGRVPRRIASGRRAMSDLQHEHRRSVRVHAVMANTPHALCGSNERTQTPA